MDMQQSNPSILSINLGNIAKMGGPFLLTL